MQSFVMRTTKSDLSLRLAHISEVHFHTLILSNTKLNLDRVGMKKPCSVPKKTICMTEHEMERND